MVLGARRVPQKLTLWVGKKKILVSTTITAYRVWNCGTGNWKRVLVTAPAAKLIQVYMGPDKNDKQIQTETKSKHLFKICSDAGVEDLYFQRRTGKLLSEWRPPAMVEAVAEDIPLPDNTFDRVFCLFSFRDFKDKRQGRWVTA